MALFIENRLVKGIIGIGGVIFVYTYYGHVQETIYKTNYPSSVESGKTDRFHFAFAVALFQFFISFIIGKIGDRKKSGVPLSDQVKQGFYSSFSMLASHSALKHVSFPVQALFKSCKIVSVLLVGLVIYRRLNYKPIQYIAGLIVTVGIASFNIIEATAKPHTDVKSQTSGLLLLLASLVSDGLIADMQENVRQKYRPSSYQMMAQAGAYASAVCLLYATVSGQLVPFVDFVTTHPTVLPDLIAISLFGALGQVLVYYTIKHFGSLVLAFATTTRKTITILWSIILHGHHILPSQWVCISLVIVGILLELQESYHKQKQSHAKPKHG